MSIGIKVKKGLDLHIEGAVADPLAITVKPATSIAVIPDDFIGIVPKVDVHDGDHIIAGQPLFHDKLHPEIVVTSPVAGTVRSVVRGERRKILRIEIDATGTDAMRHSTDGALADAQKAKEILLASGLWAMMTQRPYATVPDTNAVIRDIFVTGFDSSPLAESPAEFTDEDKANMQAGVRLLKLLTPGNVYVSRREWQKLPELPEAETVTITGPHPAGNAGTMAALIRPINKGETVLCCDLPTLIRIGATATTGIVPMETTVALTGAELKNPKIVRTLPGASIGELLKGEIKANGRHHRIISGNVLTGKAVPADGYLRYPYSQITVIPEGDDVDEFMGWASMSPRKMSVSPSFPGHFLCKKLFNPDARLLGGRRAMIMSGEYDRMIPIDIMPEYLIKAILSHDIDRMEQLGIYEVAPEDFALAEYADTSKLELQKIVREGLDYLRKEVE